MAKNDSNRLFDMVLSREKLFSMGLVGVCNFLFRFSNFKFRFSLPSRVSSVEQPMPWLKFSQPLLRTVLASFGPMRVDGGLLVREPSCISYIIPAREVTSSYCTRHLNNDKYAGPCFQLVVWGQTPESRNGPVESVLEGLSLECHRHCAAANARSSVATERARRW